MSDPRQAETTPKTEDLINREIKPFSQVDPGLVMENVVSPSFPLGKYGHITFYAKTPSTPPNVDNDYTFFTNPRQITAVMDIGNYVGISDFVTSLALAVQLPNGNILYFDSPPRGNPSEDQGRSASFTVVSDENPTTIARNDYQRPRNPLLVKAPDVPSLAFAMIKAPVTDAGDIFGKEANG